MIELNVVAGIRMFAIGARKSVVASALAAIFSLCTAASAQGAEPADTWQFSVTPYFWLPNIDGTLRFAVPPGTDSNPEVGVGPNDYLENLDFALMLAGEVRKGPWAIFSDVIALDFASESASVETLTGPGGIVEIPLDVDTAADLEGLVWELAVSYAISQSETGTFEMLGGFRYLDIETGFDWQLAGPIGQFPQSGSFSQDKDLWDVIFGVRGRAGLGGSNWFVPYYLDVGAGSSDLTWQGLAGIGYSFRWGDVRFAYRHLSIDQGGDKLIQDMAFSGPAFGATFRF